MHISRWCSTSGACTRRFRHGRWRFLWSTFSGRLPPASYLRRYARPRDRRRGLARCGPARKPASAYSRARLSSGTRGCAPEFERTRTRSVRGAIAPMVSKNANSHERTCPSSVRMNLHANKGDCARGYVPCRTGIEPMQAGSSVGSHPMHWGTANLPPLPCERQRRIQPASYFSPWEFVYKSSVEWRRRGALHGPIGAWPA